MFITLLSVPAFADGTNYYLEELDMRISIPDEFDVFTRDTKSNDPLLKKHGLTDLDYMYENNWYMEAYDLSSELQIVVMMTESTLDDYNNLSDSTMDALLSELPAMFEGGRFDFIEGDIYNHKQTKFIKMYLSERNSTDSVYSLQYDTLLDGMSITIALNSYAGKIGSAEEALAAEIVDSVSFGSAPPVSSQNTSAFVFTDEISGLSFTVPENWREDPDFKDETNAGTRFVSKYVDAPYITYYRKDVYESNLGFAKDLVTRDMFGNDLFTAEDVAEMFSCNESDVSLRSFGDKEYYFAEA
ncbi:MAG: hypothetical protein IKC02_04295, partial [Oscillospiraceae bacterium]|nr:hypothetical protein [Oscillospiraceae bacterium]